MSVTIRPFETIDEYHECVALQEATWGEGFTERVSPAILQVSQILGGVSAGAYNADGGLVGFVFGMTGVRDGEVVHWSDMLAVRPEARDGGLGRRLKVYQRETMLERGVTRMFWTFDPLQGRNAHLNVTKLGAVVREYRENMYGDTDSPLHRGIGTDRFVALWLMDSERVRRRLAEGDATGAKGCESEAKVHDRAAGSGAAGSPVPEMFALDALGGDPHPVPGSPRTGLGNEVVRIAIPSDVGTLMADDPALAVRWRVATRTVFGHYLNAGYEVREFERGPAVSAYVLTLRDRDLDA